MSAEHEQALDAAIAEGTRAWAGVPTGWVEWLRGYDVEDAAECEAWDAREVTP